MPWQKTDPAGQRGRLITDHRHGSYSTTELCARYGVCRRAGYKWPARYDAGGRPALRERSHAPHARTTVVLEARHGPFWRRYVIARSSAQWPSSPHSCERATMVSPPSENRPVNRCENPAASRHHRHDASSTRVS